MTCAKQVVRCRIETADGGIVTGENSCDYPQAVCPRAAGEDYAKCKSICGQHGHAEQVAVSHLRGRIPVRAVLEGHSYACGDCSDALRGVGLTEIYIGGERVALPPVSDLRTDK